MTALSNSGDRERREVIENLSEELSVAEAKIERLRRELAAEKRKAYLWGEADQIRAELQRERDEIAARLNALDGMRKKVEEAALTASFQSNPRLISESLSAILDTVREVEK